MAGQSAAQAWSEWASKAGAFLQAHGADPKEAVVVLPVGALLSQARQAWAQAVGGWQPRIDTIAALCASLSWQPAPPSGSPLAFPRLSLDPMVDRLLAAKALGSQEWGQQWARRDRRGFDFALEQVVSATHIWARRMQAMAPSVRAAYFERARLAVNPAGQEQAPGGRERLLMAWALEWAIETAQTGWASDALYDWRPSAWITVNAGAEVAPGTEASLTLAVMAHLSEQGLPTRWDVAQCHATVHHAEGLGPTLSACLDAEDEAQQTAAQVLLAVNASRASVEPGEAVALIALDRSLMRRVRALLEGAGASVADETGWHLSTTRAATVVSRLIQASHPRASTDDLLDWLKSGWLVPAPERVADLDSAVAHLEQWCRKQSVLSAWSASEAQTLPEAAAALWTWAQWAIEPLQAGWRQRRLSLHDWAQALVESLTRSGALAGWRADAAGEMAWGALRLDSVGLPEAQRDPTVMDAWHGLSRQTHLDGRAWQRWVGEVMEATTFRPSAPDGPVDVVITPLARAVLRPFHTIVMPGSDERQLGALAKPLGWLGVNVCDAMDLATPPRLRLAQWDALSLLMSRPRVQCLYKQGQGSEPLMPSPWFERWQAQGGQACAPHTDVRGHRLVPSQASPRPAPSLSESALALPERLSATAYESLRQCPYRFFASNLLRLREVDELEEGLDRSDWGSWLHEVLHRFHTERADRPAGPSVEDDVQAWLAAAQSVAASSGMDRDAQRPFFMPYRAGLSKLAQAYARWLHEHEQQGWRLASTEVVKQRPMPLQDGLSVLLHGQLDRVDMASGVTHPQTQGSLVIDYKTGQLDGLKSKIKAPLEDTQLAFYAALADGAPEQAAAVQAAYLHLDPKGVTLLTHADVQDASQALLAGLSHDWQRLHQGHPMWALGDGPSCTHCQARGLCRRDQWSPQGDAA